LVDCRLEHDDAADETHAAAQPQPSRNFAYQPPPLIEATPAREVEPVSSDVE
jgi:hypothetical protein